MSENTNFERKLDANGQDLSIEQKDASEHKKVQDELASTVTQLRKFVEDGTRTKSEIKEYCDKIDKEIEELNQKSQEIHSKYFDQKKVIDALEDQVIKNSRTQNVKSSDEFAAQDKEYSDAFWKYAMTPNIATSELLATDQSVNINLRTKGLSEIATSAYRYEGSGFGKKLVQIPNNHGVKYVRTDVDPSGGYLAPPEMSGVLLKRLTEVSNIRKLATTRTTYSNVFEQPVRNVLVTSGWGYEAKDPITDNNSSYLKERIPLKTMTGKVHLSLFEQQTSAFDMQAEITNDMNESFAKTEGYGFVNGNGVLEPEGLMSNSKVQSMNSGSATELTADSLVKVYGQLKYEGYAGTYDRTYIFNRRTWVNILLQKDGIGRYLWNQNALETGLPNAIMDQQYAIVPDMPDIGSNTYPVLVGDFKKGYLIVDRMQMYLVRDEVTTPGVIKYTFFRYTGGKVVMPEAFYKIKIAA